MMDQLAVAPAETVMVGDTVHDLEMAGNAVVDAIAVSYGAHERQQLLNYAPIACLDRFSDIMPVLDGHSGVQPGSTSDTEQNS